MSNFVFVTVRPDGKVESTLSSPHDRAASAGEIKVDYVPPLSAYWDAEQEVFVDIGEPPSKLHVFNYDTRQWIDPRSLDDIKAQKWEEIKSQRDQLEFGGFEYNSNIYDSDQVSQGRIMGAAAAAGVDQVWTLADNTTVELTALQLQQLYAALQSHIAGAHERGRIARQLIFDAETKEQVESIQLQHPRVLFYYQNLGGIVSETKQAAAEIEV